MNDAELIEQLEQLADAYAPRMSPPTMIRTAAARLRELVPAEGQPWAKQVRCDEEGRAIFAACPKCGHQDEPTLLANLCVMPPWTEGPPKEPGAYVVEVFGGAVGIGWYEENEVYAFGPEGILRTDAAGILRHRRIPDEWLRAGEGGK